MTQPKHFDPLLSDRVAVVTGGGGGIGAATARLFAEHGAHVVIADIDAELADETASAIAASGGSAHPITADVRNAAEVTHFARTVLDRYGRIDVLVNNVGHWLRHPGFRRHRPAAVGRALPDQPASRFPCDPRVPADHDRPGCRCDRERLVGGGAARLSRGPGVRGLKAAVIGFTRSLAVQVGNHGVRVNAVAPDVTESLQVPYSQWLSAEGRASGRAGFRSGGWACPRIRPG